MTTRKYTLKKRARTQARTRERIVDAAMALHEELGPADTTISALAERAGVQRLTVYRHFPGEREILAACTSKWLGLNPPPDLSNARGDTPAERTRSLLRAFYLYYQRTQKMWKSAYGDLDRVPELAGPMAEYQRSLDAIRDALLEDWSPADAGAVRATLGHALAFSTWQSLSASKLSATAMAALVCGWVSAAFRGEARSN